MILLACQEHHYYIRRKETKLQQCTEDQTRKKIPALLSLYMSMSVCVRIGAYYCTIQKAIQQKYQ
jgi:hypothetical protein